MQPFDGRRALVTGGASGIGRASAARLVDLGAEVFIADIASNGPEVAARLGATFHCLDVRDAEAWKRTAAACAGQAGHLDLVLLNAGVNTPPTGEPFGPDPLRWLTADGYRRTRAVNVDGVVNGVLACLPLMRGRPGDIVITGSIGSVEPIAADPFYTLSKHAVVGFARALAPTLEAHAIRLQTLCPAGVDTPLVAPDARVAGRSFAEPGYVADALMTALELGRPGDVWVAPGEGTEPFRYRYAPIR